MKQAGVSLKRLSPREEIEILREITRILSRNLEPGKLFRTAESGELETMTRPLK